MAASSAHSSHHRSPFPPAPLVNSLRCPSALVHRSCGELLALALPAALHSCLSSLQSALPRFPPHLSPPVFFSDPRPSLQHTFFLLFLYSPPSLCLAPDAFSRVVPSLSLGRLLLVFQTQVRRLPARHTRCHIQSLSKLSRSEHKIDIEIDLSFRLAIALQCALIDLELELAFAVNYKRDSAECKEFKKERIDSCILRQ